MIFLLGRRYSLTLLYLDIHLVFLFYRVLYYLFDTISQCTTVTSFNLTQCSNLALRQGSIIYTPQSADPR